MRRLLLITVLTLLAGVLVAPSPAEAGFPCAPGQGQIRGRVFDNATGLPLPEVTSIGVHDSMGGDDGEATNPANSRFSLCLDPALGPYRLQFDADNYRSEWFHNRADEASADPITVTADETVIRNESLTPNGHTLTGVVTTERGRPVFASIGIYRRTAAGWRSIDGQGNHEASGRWSYSTNLTGRFRVNFFVDHHWAEWFEDANRLRFARVIVIRPETTIVRGINGTVRFCRADTPDFCVPPGFNS
jgi:hypothetical protein